VSDTVNDVSDVLLDVRDLRVTFKMREGLLKAVDGVSFTVLRRQTLGLVGESGCGKSVTVKAVLQIVPPPGAVSGEIWLTRKAGGPPIDLGSLSPTGSEIREVRGGEIGMIFQEPMKAFSPVHTIGSQILEGILLHNTQDPKAAFDAAVDMLARVKIANPRQRMKAYPHELSGGMRQRAMIAAALACQPSILIADEPTTALDVTVQAEVLRLIKDLQADFGMSVIFITHDLGVVAEMADEVAVMYLGRIVEQANVESIFYDPQHPYTIELLRSIPALGSEPRSRLTTIEGTVPTPLNMGRRCGFYSRCRQAIKGVCNVDDPPNVEVKPGHFVRCVLYAGVPAPAQPTDPGATRL
jgi:peptide/nickel transport system ATP-binding protein